MLENGLSAPPRPKNKGTFFLQRQFLYWTAIFVILRHKTVVVNTNVAVGIVDDTLSTWLRTTWSTWPLVRLFLINITYTTTRSVSLSAFLALTAMTPTTFNTFIQCVLKTRPLRLIWHNYTSLQYLLIIFGRDGLYLILKRLR